MFWRRAGSFWPILLRTSWKTKTSRNFTWVSNRRFRGRATSAGGEKKGGDNRAENFFRGGRTMMQEGTISRRACLQVAGSALAGTLLVPSTPLWARQRK